MKGNRLTWAGLGLVIIFVLGIWYFTTGGDEEYDLATVERGAIVQEISASGNVEPASQVDLHFRGSGRLASRTVRAGDTVAAGAVLAEQDASQLQAQLSEMQAAVDVRKAQLAQLLAGATSEDVRVAETAVANAERTVRDAREALIKALQDAYTKSDDAVRTKADVVFTDPRAANPQLSFIVSSFAVESNVEAQRLVAENALRSWNTALTQLNGTDPATIVASSQANLAEVTKLLEYVAQALNAYISGSDETTIGTWKTSISTTRTTVNTAAAALASANEAYTSAQGALASAEDVLAVKNAPARPEDTALYEAQIRQAEAALQRAAAQFEETTIVAPVAGVVTRVHGEVGEIVGPGETIVSLMPEGDLQVRLNISEGNIVDVKVGQAARITLDAFSEGTEWRGIVLEIEPAETIVGGAVYYEAVVGFETDDPRIRRGMSANVQIETAANPDALTVPASAITTRDGKSYVRFLVGDEPQEREVQIGLSSSDGMVEIVTGAQAGEEVVLGERL